MAVEIPVIVGEPNQDVSCQIDGRVYLFNFKWNSRIQRWMVSLYGSDGTAIFLGKGLTNGGNAIRTTRHNPDAPNGYLSLYEPKGLGAEATLNSLGVDHFVVFVNNG